MLAPAMTGSGPSALLIARIGDELTVVASSTPAVGAVSLLSMPLVLLWITVPFAKGLVTATTSWTEPLAPDARPPMFQVTTPAASVPPPVALTNDVFAGIVSAITTPVAFWLPVFEYERG